MKSIFVLIKNFEDPINALSKTTEKDITLITDSFFFIIFWLNNFFLSQKDVSINGYRNVLKGALLEATGRSCGQTKGPARHEETWW